MGKCVQVIVFWILPLLTDFGSGWYLYDYHKYFAYYKQNKYAVLDPKI